jgi:2-pyrone-4,6-dicarboxylate lactonase
VTIAIAGPDPDPAAVTPALPAGACDCHAHIFGPSDRFPYADGRGYTPPDATLESYLALHDRLGFERGVVVQGNAHGYDNAAILDALARTPGRLRGVAITDTRIGEKDLRDWHELGVRGLRFHVFHPDHRPDYVRGVGLDVFEKFRKTMIELGWHMQVWCDWRQLPELADIFKGIAVDMPVIFDHMLNTEAALGPNHASFETLLRLLGDGDVWCKVSGAYRVSERYPDYPDAKPLHDALMRANADQLVWGSDWPHPQVDAAVMPNDGHLVNLFQQWTPDAAIRQKILVENPARLYDF